MSTIILAIDLGKFNSVLCWYEPKTHAVEFRSIKTTPSELHRELVRQPVERVVIEACSAAGWVHDLCEELHLVCVVANTTGEAWKWKNVKRKTDRDDALKLARLWAVGELATVLVPTKAMREWKSLIGLRKRLVGERGRGQNRLRSLLVSQGLPAPRGSKAWTLMGLEGLSQLAKPLADCAENELWRGEVALLLARHRFLEGQIQELEARLDGVAASSKAVQLLETVPGMGTRTAEVIASCLGDAKRFQNANAVSAYAGLVPRQYQSGETDRRGRITKRGPKLLRTALVECAWCLVRHNAWAQRVWRRLQANGLSKKKAVVALARKALVRCWGMLKRDECWREPVFIGAAAAPV
jgi:transposase